MKNYSDEDLIKAIQESTSKAQVLIKLNLAPKGGNYQVLDRSIKRLGLSIEHFKGQAWNKGKITGPRKTLDQILIKGTTWTSHAIKLRLLKDGIFQHKCYNCDLTEWLGEKIPLELEHIDGDHSNSVLSNLTLLCPNCHALTPTYRGRNKKNVRATKRSALDGIAKNSETTS